MTLLDKFIALSISTWWQYKLKNNSVVSQFQFSFETRAAADEIIGQRLQKSRHQQQQQISSVSSDGGTIII